MEPTFDLHPDRFEIVVRLCAAVLLGGALGFEREWRGKEAGLRTHMMVALGSAAFTLVATEMYARLVAESETVARVDLLRLVEGIVGGIGFLGAGSIIRSRGSVEGLTTAGSLWFVGSVGLAAGGGHLWIAVSATALALFVLVVVGYVEHRFLPER